MDELLLELKHIGFSEMEGKCFITLAQNQLLTGYEIAKKLGASRSNVYASLQSLVEKGFVLTSKGEPSYFQSITFDELQNKIRNNLENSLDKLEKKFPTSIQNFDDFFTLEGYKQVIDRLTMEIRQAKKEILIDFWAEEIDWFRELLLEREKGGVRIIASTLGEVDLPLKTVLTAEREEAWQQEIGRKFSILIDRKVTILGVCHQGFHTKALFTKHPAMTSLLLNNLFHDLVIHEIGNDFKLEMEKRYGRNFEKIAKKYFEMDWNN
jgi:sugar-specific transcriptional regulator TrmB